MKQQRPQPKREKRYRNEKELNRHILPRAQHHLFEEGVCLPPAIVTHKNNNSAALATQIGEQIKKKRKTLPPLLLIRLLFPRMVEMMMMMMTPRWRIETGSRSRSMIMKAARSASLPGPLLWRARIQNPLHAPASTSKDANETNNATTAQKEKRAKEIKKKKKARVSLQAFRWERIRLSTPSLAITQGYILEAEFLFLF